LCKKLRDKGVFPYFNAKAQRRKGQKIVSAKAKRLRAQKPKDCERKGQKIVRMNDCNCLVVLCAPLRLCAKSFYTVLLVCFLVLTSSCSKESPKEPESPQTLSIAIAGDPTSLDPRLARDLPTATVLKLLYEGLTRIDRNGEAQLALAQQLLLSEDRKSYTFTLRPSSWSDGTQVTATDFEETWKSLLAPDFPAPNAYQLYIIKNAKAAKEGQLPLDQIGIKATAHDTLTVELEHPCPYFLQLLACHFFFPVPSAMRASGIVLQPQAHSASNGPFKFSSWQPRSQFAVEKNPAYWDADAVKMEKIALLVLDENTALQLFLSDQLDWAGSPLSTLPQDAVPALKAQKLLQIASGAGTQWFRFNTQVPPFNDPRLRRALSLALNRQEIAEHVTQGGQTPAIGIIPPVLGIPPQHYYQDHDTAEAQRLFKEAQPALMQKPIFLRYVSNDRNQKIAQTVQQQWNSLFGPLVELQGSEAQLFLDHLRRGDYQVALGSWFADIRDPLNFLEIFESKQRATNQTFWESARYQTLLERSTQENAPEERLRTLLEAEELLMEAMPVAPLLHSSFNYLVSPRVQNVYFSELGYLDFKHAYMRETSQP
jgi:oligopeptide transport system substrate-binding protein